MEKNIANKIDNTSFILDYTNLWEYFETSKILYGIIKDIYEKGELTDKKYLFKTYILTPENLISDFYKISFFIEFMFIKDLKMTESSDI